VAAQTLTKAKRVAIGEADYEPEGLDVDLAAEPDPKMIANYR
jgi:hypothetical protein